MIVHEDECEAAGLNPAEVRRIAARIDRAAKDAQLLGLVIFGGSGHGSLRRDMHDGFGPVIVAELDGSWDGGDGGNGPSPDGLLRGEIA